MDERSLHALGLDDVASTAPLVYPGKAVEEPSLLQDELLLPLDVTDGPLGGWLLPDGVGLDKKLAGLGLATIGRRFPVIAVGSNASPGQMRHKLTRFSLPVVVPMVPAKVRGVGVGVSGHVSPAGYVAASPFVRDGLESELIITWLDADQIKVVDDTETPEYQRVFLEPAEYPVTLPSGEVLPGAYLYVNARGVLKRPDGQPRDAADQRKLLTDLINASPRLRSLFGPDPETWVARAGKDPSLRAKGTDTFGREGWVLGQFTRELRREAPPRTYDQLLRRA